MEIFGILSVWAFLGFVGVLIAESKNRDKGEGCALGCLLGPFGWLIEAFLDSKEPEGGQSRSGSSEGRSAKSSDWGRPKRKCPHCAEVILLEAKVCKHCGRDVEPGVKEDRVQPCPYCGVPISVEAEECPECLVVEPFE